MKPTPQEIVEAGYKAYSPGAALLGQCPYYPGSPSEVMFRKGWERARWEQTVSSGCPWKSQIVCVVGRRVCSAENCAVWFFLNKKEGV